jgi:nicotinate-nucleotide adenylyltransferase
MLPPIAATREIILFGGTFDPPHRAHFTLAARALEVHPQAALLFVPAARSPHKSAAPLATDDQRMAMLQAGILDAGLQSRAAVWDVELERAATGGGPSYFVDTVRQARALTPASTRLFFVLGSDQVAAFDRWREPHEILSLADPIVLLRRVHDDATPLHAFPEFGSAALTGQPLLEVSSTQIRELLTADPADPSLGSLLTPGVLALARGIYRRDISQGT